MSTVSSPERARAPSRPGTATVVALGVRARVPQPRPAAVGWAAVVIAVVLAASPLTDGYFSFDWWGAIALGAMVLLVVLAGVARPGFTRYGIAASVGLASLLALSAASILWAESRDSAWTEVNRLALYGALFAIVLLAVRDRRTGRLIVVILGSAALLASLLLCASWLLGAGQGALLTRRLNSPIGYINGTACLLVMGVWPWIACAEAASSRLVRAGALAGASVIAGMLVLTQSRAVLPAAILGAVLVVACTGGRAGRAINLVLVAASVAVALPWTLAVYSTGGAADRLLLPSHGLLRAAAAAILLAAIAAGLMRLALSCLAERVEPDRRNLAMHRLGWTMAVGAILTLAVGSVLGGPFIARQYRAFTALQVNENAATRFTDASGYRYDLWRVAVHEFDQHPLGGLGAGNYDDEYYLLRRNPEYVTVPHSLELQMAAELGVGGLIALLGFCGAILAACWARRGTLASGDRLIKVAAAGMFAAWLIDTSVDWTYDIPGLAGAAIVAAALLVVPARSPKATGPRSRRALAGAALALTVLALLAASVGRQYAATRYQNAGAAEIARSPRAALGTLTEAEKLDPYSLTTLYSIAAAYAREDSYQRARDTLLQAAAREPESYVPPALLADLAVRRGDTGLAEIEYRRALALNPADPQLRQAVAER
jgi:tetratricopeptide (TPR) repeat protein